MRVLHFRTRFSPLSETFIYDVVREVERQGTESVVLCTRRENPEERPYGHVHVLEDEVRLSPRERLAQLPALVRGPAGREAAGRRRTRALLRKAFRLLEPAVIHAHFGWDSEMAAPVAGSLGIPLVASFHGSDAFMLPLDPLWRRRYARLWGRADVVTGVSELMISTLRELGCPEDRLRVIHVGKDMENYPYRPRVGPVERLLVVGRLVEKKGVGDALQAMAALVRHGWDSRLEVIGDGPLRGSLERQRDDLGLGSNVRFLGALPHSAVVEALQRADLLLLPSRTASDGDMEGLPTVLLEAQALGLPWVATDHSGIPEGVPARLRSSLIPEGDPEGLAAAIRELSDLPLEERLARVSAARAWVEGRFNLRMEVGKLIEIYHRLGQSQGSHVQQ